jgi:hypothetical protein
MSNNTITTRSAILREAIAILEASARPLHYKELAQLISWSPDPGARTSKENSVYFYCYEDDQDGERIKFLRRGVFGLKGRKYTDEQIRSAVPVRKGRSSQESDKQVAYVPAELTEEQKALLKSMGILLG